MLETDTTCRKIFTFTHIRLSFVDTTLLWTIAQIMQDIYHLGKDTFQWNFLREKILSSTNSQIIPDIHCLGQFAYQGMVNTRYIIVVDNV